MASIVASHLSLLLLLLTPAAKTSCSRYLQQESKSPIPNRWYGSLTLHSERDLFGVWLKLEFDARVEQLGSWFGQVLPKNDDHIEFLIKDHGHRLRAGTSETFRIYVQHADGGAAPRLVSLKLNEMVLCRAGGDNDDVCGRVVVHAAPLITFGEPANEGRYPWHVAIYHDQTNYVCGGTLIARSYVLTAGHCVFKRQKKLATTREISVRLGQHYLDVKANTHVQMRAVSDIKLHPTYNSANYRNDIALLKLDVEVDFDDYVRHVCVSAPGPHVGEGVVVGWGFDATGKLSNELMQTNMPVVSQESCIFSNPDFYSRFTSEKTYCAGYRNGSSVCNGDSGGGMVYEIGRRWYLRGIVSLAVPLLNFTCDTSNYVIFTDVTKYAGWLKQSMME